MTINIYRSGTPIANFNCAADGIATYTRSLMNEHKIVCNWISYEALGLMIGDYIEYNGIKFKINTPPSETKTASYAYQYQVTFEAPIYDLYNKIYSHDDGDGWVTEWNLGGSPEDFIDILLANLNSIDSGWTKGDIDTADDQLIDFTNVTCREALNTIAETFDMEWYLNNKEIHLIKKVGADSSLVFEYGQGKGLYELSRQAIDNKNLVTRLLVFGSDRNNNGKKLSIPAIDTNTDKYGIREAVKVFDEVYPHRESLIGTVAIDGLSFQDSTMDFDLNAFLTTDTAQISFLSGDLVGYNLEITGYNATTKTFALKKFTDTDGTALPSADDKPRTGDKYTIIGITMPQTYVDAAIAELTTKGNDYAAENGIPRVQYACKLDMIWASDNNILVNIGDRVTVKDAAMGIDNQIRVSSVSFPLYQPFNMTFVIADSVGYTVQQRIIAKTIDNTKAIQTVDRSRILDYRRGYANQEALRESIFDPSGNYFDPANIKPQSIETLMLSVGAKSQAFTLPGARATIAGSNKAIDLTAATLIHAAIEIPGLGSAWEIPSVNKGIPVTSQVYYLYAKCSTTQLTGTWEVSMSQHTVDEEVGYYWFLVGTIFAVDQGVRGIAMSYGYASINGRIITAGRIQSLDGKVWFDLDLNQFNIGDPSGSGFDWNVTIANDLVLRGGFVQRAPGILGPIPLDRGTWGSTQTYFLGDRVVYNGQSYNYINESSSTGHLPTDTTYWQISAAQGDKGYTGSQGNYVEHRFAKNGSPTAAPTLDDDNANPPGWTTAQPSVGLLEYMWMTTATKTAAGALVTNWSAPTRLSGPKGDNGPTPTYRGLWDSGTVYHGTDLLVEAVKYTDNIYYLTRVDAGNIPAGTLPTNTDYWNSIGANFESVATGLLLADYARIEKLIVGELASEAPNSSGVYSVPYLKAKDAEIDFWPAGTTASEEANPASKALARIGKGVGFMQSSGENRPGFSARDVEGDDRYSEMTSAGIFTNGSNVSGLPSFSVTNNASIAALLFGRNNGLNGISAAILGVDGTTDADGSSASYGGYFNTLFGGGLHVGTKSLSVATTYVVEDGISLISTYADSASTTYIDLPAHPKPGRYVKVIYPHAWGKPDTVIVRGNGHNLNGIQGEVVSSVNVKYNFGLQNSDSATFSNQTEFFFDGSNWIYSRIYFWYNE